MSDLVDPLGSPVVMVLKKHVELMGRRLLYWVIKWEGKRNRTLIYDLIVVRVDERRRSDLVDLSEDTKVLKFGEKASQIDCTSTAYVITSFVMCLVFSIQFY